MNSGTLPLLIHGVSRHYGQEIAGSGIPGKRRVEFIHSPGSIMLQIDSRISLDLIRAEVGWWVMRERELRGGPLKEKGFSFDKWPLWLEAYRLREYGGATFPEICRYLKENDYPLKPEWVGDPDKDISPDRARTYYRNGKKLVEGGYKRHIANPWAGMHKDRKS